MKNNIYILLAKQYLRNILVSLDQLVNVVTFGDEDETISSRLGKSQRGDFGPVHKAIAFPIAKAVDFLALHIFNDVDHCATNIEENVGGKSLLSVYRAYRDLDK